MHIVDGALDLRVLAGGAVLAVAGIAQGVRKLDLELIPVAGVISAVFFVASLIHVPVGPSSVHLILNGLAGLVLGWAAFPALFVGLALQAVFFGYGGITVLGVNTVNIALPAVLVGVLFGRLLIGATPRRAAAIGALAGGLSIGLTTVLVALSLALSGDEFVLAAKLTLVSHLPLIAVEAALTAAAAHLVARVKPEVFSAVSGAGPA